MKKNILLSICIPTYNREKYLKECLDSIINQDGFNENVIEIIISDNASTDKTKEIIENYQKKYKKIYYCRNQKNIGPIKNILKILKMGEGEFIRGLSDDDFLLPGSLKTIIETIKKNKEKDVGFIQTNFTSYKKDGKTIIKESFLGDNLETKTYKNIHQLYKSYNYIHNGLSFFSINIFRSQIHNLDLDNIPYNDFIHSCIAGLIGNKKAIFINKNIVGYRTENNAEDFSNLKHFFKVFVLSHITYMKFLKKNHSLVSQKQLTKILIKMIIYSGYLRCKSIIHKLYKLIKK